MSVDLRPAHVTATARTVFCNVPCPGILVYLSDDVVTSHSIGIFNNTSPSLQPLVSTQLPNHHQAHFPNPDARPPGSACCSCRSIAAAPPCMPSCIHAAVRETHTAHLTVSIPFAHHQHRRLVGGARPEAPVCLRICTTVNSRCFPSDSDGLFFRRS